MKTIFEKPYVKVFYNETLRAVEVCWFNFVSHEKYIEALNFAMKVIETSCCKRWLSDMRKSGAVSPKTTHWVQDEFIPKAYKKGIRKAAFVVSDNVFNKVYTSKIRETIINQGIEIQYFKTRPEAENWLRDES